MSALREASSNTFRSSQPGLQLINAENTLRSFVAFAEREEASHVTTDLALRWVKLFTVKESATLADRLNRRV